MKRLVFATNNQHKLEEARAILGSDVELVSLSEIGCHEDIPETHPTLEGNALQKARYVHERYGVECVADDTGLMVEALGGAPGVLSARYAGGAGHDSEANMAKLLKNMEGRTDREACFKTVLAMVSDSEERLFEGRVDGSIATERSGAGGFGYDPVFICKETGRTFADMSAEEKNAISHRGRAFRAFRDWLLLLTSMLLLLAVSPAQAAQWRQHMSYDGQMLRIIDSPKFTYFIPLKGIYNPGKELTMGKFGQLYRYDKENDEWKWLNAYNGLSENIVVNAAYDFKNRLLAVAYDTGNIDLLSDSGEKVNIPGLKMAGSNASADILDINVDEGEGDIWVTTASGYVRLDPVKGEVATSRNYGRAITSVAKLGEYVIVCTDNGAFYGSELSGDLSNFRAVPGSDGKEFRQSVPLGDRVYVRYGPGNNLIGYIAMKDGVPTWTLTSWSAEYSMERGKDCVITNGHHGARIYDRSHAMTERLLPESVRSLNPYAASLDGKSWWVSAGRKGIARLTFPEEGGNWTMTMDYHFPNAANAFRCTTLTYDARRGMMIRNHGAERGFGNKLTYDPDLICAYKDGEWSPLSLSYSDSDPQGVFGVGDPIGLAVDPVNPDHVYCGSVQDGLLRLDLSDGSKSLRVTRRNDPKAGMPGCVAVMDVMNDWTSRCGFGEPVFDDNGVLWTPFYNSNTNMAELYYWTPEDRLASTSSSAFRPMQALRYRDITGSHQSIILPLSRQKNMLVYYNGSNPAGLMVLMHNGTLDNQSDDVRRTVSTFVDQDGNAFTYGFIYQMTEDPSTGRVWVASEGGVFNFNPVDVANGNAVMRRVKVARNDGTNLADYLLDGAAVTQIMSDRAGRKWFATNGAGVVVTSADGSQIVRTYDTSNSDILSDAVYGMGYNPDNESMMLSTEQGLCEVFLSEAESSGSASVRAYPNPVRPGFPGMVTVDLLPDDAMVKIADAAGHTVRDLGRAVGGEIEWDLTNNSRRRVPAGIYYVLASNGPDGSAFSKMTKILVVE